MVNGDPMATSRLCFEIDNANLFEIPGSSKLVPTTPETPERLGKTLAPEAKDSGAARKYYLGTRSHR